MYKLLLGVRDKEREKKRERKRERERERIISNKHTKERKEKHNQCKYVEG